MMLETIKGAFKNWFRNVKQFFFNLFSSQEKHKSIYPAAYHRTQTSLQIAPYPYKEIQERVELLEKKMNTLEKEFLSCSHDNKILIEKYNKYINVLEEGIDLRTRENNLLRSQLLFFNNTSRTQPSIHAPSIEPVKIPTLSRSM